MNSHPTLADVSSICLGGRFLENVDSNDVVPVVERLTEELRKAGSAGMMHLRKKGELLVPNRLLETIADRVLEMSEDNLYGSR